MSEFEEIEKIKWKLTFWQNIRPFESMFKHFLSVFEAWGSKKYFFSKMKQDIEIRPREKFYMDLNFL